MAGSPSVREIPASREKNRQFVDFRPSWRFQASIYVTIPARCARFPGRAEQGIFSHRTANYWPEQGIRASTKIGPKLGLRGEIANARQAGFSAAIGDAADLVPTASFRRTSAPGRLGVQERDGRGWHGDGYGHLESGCIVLS